MNLDGPFVAGRKNGGNILHPGYERLRFEVVVGRIDPEYYFGHRFHPYAVDQLDDFSH